MPRCVGEGEGRGRGEGPGERREERDQAGRLGRLGIAKAKRVGPRPRGYGWDKA
jgi:hypothetical protein|tara:strand:- start:1831 stop:1992 length:162 start_codon:yes stop_codon:yes gene_type:complete